MATTTFSGPIRSGTIKHTTGTTPGTDVANVGKAVLAQTGTVVFGASGSTTTVASLPAGAQIIDIILDVTTAFDAGTTNTISFGDGTTADEFASALAAGSAARVLASSDVSQLANYTITDAVNVVATYTQTGTAAAAGAATVTVQYVQN